MHVCEIYIHFIHSDYTYTYLSSVQKQSRINATPVVMSTYDNPILISNYHSIMLLAEMDSRNGIGKAQDEPGMSYDRR